METAITVLIFVIGGGCVALIIVLIAALMKVAADDLLERRIAEQAKKGLNARNGKEQRIHDKNV